MDFLQKLILRFLIYFLFSFSMASKQDLSVDYKLFFAIVILVLFGMIMISSVSVFSSFKFTSVQALSWLIAEPYNYFYVVRNILHVLTGFTLLAIIVKIPYTFFEKYASHILGGTTILLLYVHFFGATYKWAKWWIDVPFLPFNIQPTEILKLSLILFLAVFFKKNLKYLQTFKKGFYPFLLILWVFVWIVGSQPDFGTVMVIVPVSVIMFFLAGANVRYLSVLVLVGMLGAYGIYSAGKYDHAHPETRTKLSYITDRVDYFLDGSKNLFNPTAENTDKTYQIKQALITIGSGGATGLGFGHSIQKFGYLPEVQWDFIFSVIVEELGFIGAFILLSLYLYIAYRGFYIYEHVQDAFAKFTAAGISSWFIIQAFINIWVNLNIVPLTWITLPFVSYGWSSLITLMLALGVLLNISRYTHSEPKYKKRFGRKMVLQHL